MLSLCLLFFKFMTMILVYIHLVLIYIYMAKRRSRRLQTQRLWIRFSLGGVSYSSSRLRDSEKPKKAQYKEKNISQNLGDIV